MFARVPRHGHKFSSFENLRMVVFLWPLGASEIRLLPPALIYDLDVWEIKGRSAGFSKRICKLRWGKTLDTSQPDSRFYQQTSD